MKVYGVQQGSTSDICRHKRTLTNKSSAISKSLTNKQRRNEREKKLKINNCSRIFEKLKPKLAMD